MSLPRTIFKTENRKALLERLANVKREQTPRWGRLTAPAMIVHLCDQLRMALGDVTCEPVPSIFHNPIVRSMYLYTPGPMEKNFKGPREAFLTVPTNWDKDMATLRQHLNRVAVHEPPGGWPDHPNLGRMSKRAWGVFTYRHFHHHLKQFEV